MVRIKNFLISIVLVGICINFADITFADDYQYHPKEKEFTKAFITALPDGYEHKKKFIEECNISNYNCLPTQLVAYANLICEQLDNRRPIKEIYENMVSFFGYEEGVAIVDASIHVICPHHTNKLKQ